MSLSMLFGELSAHELEALSRLDVFRVLCQHLLRPCLSPDEGLCSSQRDALTGLQYLQKKVLQAP